MASVRLLTVGVAVVVVAMLQRVTTTMTTPTPYAVRPNVYSDTKPSTYDVSSVGNIDARLSTSDANQEAVVYVDKSDYDDLAKSASASDDDVEPLRRPADDLFPDLTGIRSAELYRILALGQTRPAPSLGLQFGGILNKITQTLPRTLADVDHCPDRPEIGIQYYCMKLEDGLYFDPWNPWCGYIRCRGGVAERICCKQGTWLGPGVMFQPFYKTNQKDMCRRPLRSNIIDGKCPMPSTKDICKTAIKVEKMNPPNPRPDITTEHLSKIDLARYSRIEAPMPPSTRQAPASSQKTKAQQDRDSTDGGATDTM